MLKRLISSLGLVALLGVSSVEAKPKQVTLRQYRQIAQSILDKAEPETYYASGNFGFRTDGRQYGGQYGVYVYDLNANGRVDNGDIIKIIQFRDYIQFEEDLANVRIRYSGEVVDACADLPVNKCNIVFGGLGRSNRHDLANGGIRYLSEVADACADLPFNKCNTVFGGLGRSNRHERSTITRAEQLEWLREINRLYKANLQIR